MQKSLSVHWMIWCIQLWRTYWHTVECAVGRSIRLQLAESMIGLFYRDELLPPLIFAWDDFFPLKSKQDVTFNLVNNRLQITFFCTSMNRECSRQVAWKLVAACTQKCFGKLTPLPDEHTSISTNDCNCIHYIQFRGVNYFLDFFGTCLCIYAFSIASGDWGQAMWKVWEVFMPLQLWDASEWSLDFLVVGWLLHEMDLASKLA